VTNGQGKTNLIEVINLVGLSRSVRTRSFQELIQHGSADNRQGLNHFQPAHLGCGGDHFGVLRQKN
jgi:recombinational DNA repair ATPase RecF